MRLGYLYFANKLICISAVMLNSAMETG